jgi:hypothetical protein
VHYNSVSSRYTIILNLPRGWGGKPTGSHADSRVAEISKDMGDPVFFVETHGESFGTAFPRRKSWGTRDVVNPDW